MTFADGRQTRGTVAGWDGDGDLAVIDVDTANAVAIEWGDGEGLAGRDSGLRGRRQPRRRDAGHVRPRLGGRAGIPGPGGRRIEGSVEHTAPLAPGSSGGALLDAAGHLVGLNTNRIGEGFYLALPADAGAAHPDRRLEPWRDPPSARAWAWPSPRRTSRARCAVRSGSRA